MRSLFLLLALAFAAPSFADDVYCCFSTYAQIPKPTFWESLGEARAYADGRMGWSTPSAVTESCFTEPDVDYTIHQCTYTGSTSGGSRSYTLAQFFCNDPDATFQRLGFKCVGGATELSAEDIAVYVGYILGAFSLGFAMGYLFRVFYKAVDMI
jgi:hypothetical protein